MMIENRRFALLLLHPDEYLYIALNACVVFRFEANLSKGKTIDCNEPMNDVAM